ncbi:hypothetical protein TEA_012024 [Camellia sinensis var. sinensis]|uniref:Chaperone DnaJ C-terminal domain-containing protein n=1 Tax=Camellia sinensis var. sinensis TaxID=542762 RepID=A0A4S4DV81_CAMSN|nr:hypothetical protein TEA_012024 [Camellia sinensis var. sinensis]
MRHVQLSCTELLELLEHPEEQQSCLFYKRESCSLVDSEEFEPEALVDSGVAHRKDNSEVKTGWKRHIEFGDSSRIVILKFDFEHRFVIHLRGFGTLHLLQSEFGDSSRIVILKFDFEHSSVIYLRGFETLRFLQSEVSSSLFLSLKYKILRGPHGDLYVYLDIEEILEIQRDGINLRSSVSISYLDAILGTVVKVKTVEGTTDQQIPSSTQPGDVLVLAKKGAPKLNRPSIRGDHLFTIKVSIHNRIRVLLRRLHLYNIERMDNAALCAALSACPSLLDLEIVGLSYTFSAVEDFWFLLLFLGIQNLSSFGSICLHGLQEKIKLVPIDLQNRPDWYKEKVDIAYAPFIERFYPLLLDVKKYDITTGRPMLTSWIEGFAFLYMSNDEVSFCHENNGVGVLVATTDIHKANFILSVGTCCLNSTEMHISDFMEYVDLFKCWSKGKRSKRPFTSLSASSCSLVAAPPHIAATPPLLRRRSHRLRPIPSPSTRVAYATRPSAPTTPSAVTRPVTGSQPEEPTTRSPTAAVPQSCWISTSMHDTALSGYISPDLHLLQTLCLKSAGSLSPCTT